MMNQREINIYLSKLISNPKYSIKMYENLNKFMDKYYIATESREVLINFFKKMEEDLLVRRFCKK